MALTSPQYLRRDRCSNSSLISYGVCEMISSLGEFTVIIRISIYSSLMSNRYKIVSCVDIFLWLQSIKPTYLNAWEWDLSLKIWRLCVVRPPLTVLGLQWPFDSLSSQGQPLFWNVVNDAIRTEKCILVCRVLPCYSISYRMKNSILVGIS